MSEAAFGSGGLAGQLRQMLAVLERERQALAALDLDALVRITDEKHALCGWLDQWQPASPRAAVSTECHGLLESARRQNEVNRKVRNLLAANVAARLDALTQSPGLYSAPQIARI